MSRGALSWRYREFQERERLEQSCGVRGESSAQRSCQCPGETTGQRDQLWVRGWVPSELAPWGSDPASNPEPPALFLTWLAKGEKDDPSEIKKSA